MNSLLIVKNDLAAKELIRACTGISMAELLVGAHE